MRNQTQKSRGDPTDRPYEYRVLDYWFNFVLKGNIMQARVKDFFSEFHRQKLKPIGFKKINHTFSRDKGSYIERFNFQGSSWNSSDTTEPWFFYINVGVQFKELALPTPNFAFPKTHYHWRIEDLISLGVISRSLLRTRECRALQARSANESFDTLALDTKSYTHYSNTPLLAAGILYKRSFEKRRREIARRFAT